MQLKSVFLGLSFDEIIPEGADEGHAAESYAVELCSEEQAHLSVFMATPIFHVPGAGLLPLRMRSLMRSTPSVGRMPRRQKKE